MPSLESTLGTHQTTGTRIFASRDPEIAAAKNKAARDRMIKALAQSEIGTPQHNLIWNSERKVRLKPMNLSENRQFSAICVSGCEYLRTFCRTFFKISKGECTILVTMYRHPQDIIGLIDFSKLASGAGMIVPTGIATDSSTSAFLAILFLRNVLMAYLTLKIRKVFFLVYIAVSSSRFYQ